MTTAGVGSDERWIAGAEVVDSGVSRCLSRSAIECAHVWLCKLLYACTQVAVKSLMPLCVSGWFDPTATAIQLVLARVICSTSSSGSYSPLAHSIDDLISMYQTPSFQQQPPPVSIPSYQHPPSLPARPTSAYSACPPQVPPAQPYAVHSPQIPPVPDRPKSAYAAPLPEGYGQPVVVAPIQQPVYNGFQATQQSNSNGQPSRKGWSALQAFGVGGQETQGDQWGAKSPQAGVQAGVVNANGNGFGSSWSDYAAPPTQPHRINVSLYPSTRAAAPS